jgi:hypothetical protein
MAAQVATSCSATRPDSSHRLAAADAVAENCGRCGGREAPSGMVGMVGMGSATREEVCPLCIRERKACRSCRACPFPSGEGVDGRAGLGGVWIGHQSLAVVHGGGQVARVGLGCEGADGAIEAGSDSVELAVDRPGGAAMPRVADEEGSTSLMVLRAAITRPASSRCCATVRLRFVCFMLAPPVRR